MCFYSRTVIDLSLIHILSSPTGAAIQDIRSVVSRRYPAAQIDLYPVKVQGTSSAKEVIAGLDYLKMRIRDSKRETG